MIYEPRDRTNIGAGEKKSALVHIQKVRKKYRWPVTLTLWWGIRFIVSLPFLPLSLWRDMIWSKLDVCD